jgi:hypothetical protein
MESVEKECDELKAALAKFTHSLAEEIIPIIVKILSDDISKYYIKIRRAAAPEHLERSERVCLCR